MIRDTIGEIIISIHKLILSSTVSEINFLDNSVYFSAFSKKDTGFKIRKLA